MEDVRVIAIDRRRGTDTPSAQKSTTVMVDVNRVEAQKLALAQQIGRLSLILSGFYPPPKPAPRRTCERPWSKYPSIPPDILIPELPCHSSQPRVRVRRGERLTPDAP